MSKRLMFLFAALMLVFSTVFTPRAQVHSAAMLAPTGESFVRVLHAVPGAGAVDVWVDGSLVISNLAFGEISPYYGLISGNHDILVVPTGAVTPEIINAAGVSFASATDYTIAARLDGSAVVPEIFVDDNTMPDLGNAHVRFIHLSPDAPAVDVAPAGEAAVISNISYSEYSGYVPLPGNIYDLEVRLTGTTDVALVVPDVELNPGTVYTVFALGRLSGGPDLFAKLVADSGYARVRVVHASPDAPNVDVYVDGTLVLTDVAYKQVSSYLKLPSGPHNIRVFETGTMTTAVIDADVSLMAEQDYTIAAAGQLASIEPVVYMDDNRMPAPENAHVRFIHLSPDAPAVDIAVAGGPVLFPDVEFKEASNYLPVEANTYNLEVRLAGMATVVLPVPNVALSEGKVYTVFAFGLAGGTPVLEAVALNDNASARLRVLHASPDAPNVDVYVDGMMALEDVPFGALSDYLTIPAGQHFIQVAVTGTDSVVLEAMPVLLAMQDYTAAAVGEVGEGTLALELVMDDNAKPAAGHARVRFIHLSPDAPAVDVAVSGGPTLFTDIEYLEISPYIVVDPGTYTLDVFATGTTTTPALTVPDVVLEANRVYTVFAIGLLSDSPALNALLSTDAIYYVLYMPFVPKEGTP